MPLDWPDIALRLALALAAGAVLGFDRTTRGRPAGMRTTMLVCTAGAAAMVLADLVSQAGSLHQSGTRFDPLRMAQGILAGMGFIGAGAIVRRHDIIHGVTTAAALWFATVVGLCFGAGEWRVGAASLVAGAMVLWPLNHIENNVKREHTGTLELVAPLAALSVDDLRRRIGAAGCTTISWSVALDRASESQTISCRVIWRARLTDDRIPTFVTDLSGDPKVTELKWEPVLS
jgi:putative Mg2+ transporter-C (MgtC) family protein